MATKWISATVIENKKLTDRHFALIFKADLLPFEAGQFARLQVEVENNEGELELLAKPYSLVNTPDDEYAEVYFNTVPNGKVSNALAQLQAGDTLEVSQPCVGFFVLSLIPEVQHIWMLSTGTGVGPYLSMLKTKKVWKRFEKIILVHAVPYANELCYSETIERFANQYPNKFQFIPIVSREDHGGALKGRIPELIKSGVLEEKAGLKINKENSHIMLCGNSGMLK
ncbi:MAG: ferredoxin--NADP reductase, partial [Thiotrichaceae bacterium]